MSELNIFLYKTILYSMVKLGSKYVITIYSQCSAFTFLYEFIRKECIFYDNKYEFAFVNDTGLNVLQLYVYIRNQKQLEYIHDILTFFKATLLYNYIVLKK
jgi:hypothetical protein